jgi:hypothetical protein
LSGIIEAGDKASKIDVAVHGMDRGDVHVVAKAREKQEAWSRG